VWGVFWPSSRRPGGPRHPHPLLRRVATARSPERCRKRRLVQLVALMHHLHDFQAETRCKLATGPTTRSHWNTQLIESSGVLQSFPFCIVPIRGGVLASLWGPAWGLIAQVGGWGRPPRAAPRTCDVDHLGAPVGRPQPPSPQPHPPGRSHSGQRGGKHACPQSGASMPPRKDTPPDFSALIFPLLPKSAT